MWFYCWIYQHNYRFLWMTLQHTPSRWLSLIVLLLYSTYGGIWKCFILWMLNNVCRKMHLNVLWLIKGHIIYQQLNMTYHVQATHVYFHVLSCVPPCAFLCMAARYIHSCTYTAVCYQLHRVSFVRLSCFPFCIIYVQK